MSRQRTSNTVNNSSTASLDLWDIEDDLSDEFDEPASTQNSLLNTSLTLNRSGDLGKDQKALNRSGDLNQARLNGSAGNLNGSSGSLNRSGSTRASNSPVPTSPAQGTSPGDLTRRSLSKSRVLSRNKEMSRSKELNRSGDLSLALVPEGEEMSVMNPSMNKSLEQLVMTNYYLGDESESESGHSLTLVDLEGKDSFEKTDEKRKIATDEERKMATRGVLQTGIAMSMAPLLFFFGKCFCNSKDDGVDIVAKPPPPESAKTTMSNSVSTNGTSTTSRMQMQQQMMQQSSRQMVHQSSRQVAAGYYAPQSTISQQVLRQAAISAARSASASAGQGATVLASSAAAGAAGAAVGTKILLVGLFFGLFAGGAGIATGIALKNRNDVDAMKNETLVGGGIGSQGGIGSDGKGGGFGSGFGSNNTFGEGDNVESKDDLDLPVVIPTCLEGEVVTRLEDGTLGCVSAVGICEDWQQAVDGVCENCYVGQVSAVDADTHLPTHLDCTPCLAGEVRSSSDGEALGPCVPAADFCQPWEQAVGGRCTSCFTGQVSQLNEDGIPTHVGCSFCPDGQVRSSKDGRGEGPCVPAKDYCDSWQFATNGRCMDCDVGKASAADPTTLELTYEGCAFCPEGTVRSSSDGVTLGPCVPANEYCESWQSASGGKCEDCTTGQESSRDIEGLKFTHEFCTFCENGQVRSSRDGETLGPCVSAVGICEIQEQATRGRCSTCPEGQATSIDKNLDPDHKSCLFCKKGEVRSSANGLALGPCVSASGYCQPWEYAQYGRCNTCAEGQVATKNADGFITYVDCGFCQKGQVRGRADGKAEDLCVSAVGICQRNEIAIKGRCSGCLDQETSSVDANGNFDHLSCV